MTPCWSFQIGRGGSIYTTKNAAIRHQGLVSVCFLKESCLLSICSPCLDLVDKWRDWPSTKWQQFVYKNRGEGRPFGQVGR